MDKNKIITEYSSQTFYLPGISALVTETKSPRPTSTTLDDTQTTTVAPWGYENDFPQKVIEDVRKDPEIGTLLDKQARLLYSGGLIWGTIETQEGGKEIMKPLAPARDKIIKDAFRMSNIKRYLLEATRDLYWFGNIFPELVTSRDRKTIAQICVQAAEECRWSYQDPNTGLIKHCYINANWPDATATDKLTKKLPVLDPYFNVVEQIKSAKETNFIYPLSYPSPGNKYYQLTDWNSIRSSGWLDVSRAIPKIKKYLLEKQTTIKYHIEISQLYWEKKYPDFATKSQEEKVKIKEEDLKAFQSTMSGTDQAGNNFITAMLTDEVNGKEFSLWKITPIDDKISDGKYLEDGKEASLYKMSAVGLHPALVGTMPNNGLGGAGSNIREAYNLHMLSVTAHQDIILEPIYVMRDYNDWGDDVEFRFRNSFMNTLDKGTETTKSI